MADRKYKYYAFISYNSADTKWGKRLHHRLERHKMPATLCSERGWERRPVTPVFFAPYDIQPGPLSEELKQRLRDSGNLIVICSPNSARSQWVGKEIAYFHELGRQDRIYFFIVDGVPNSGDPDTECFHPVVKELDLPESLGANIHEKVYRWPWLNRQRAYIQLISKLLHVEFDYIWKRHRRQLIANAIMWAIGVIAVIGTLVATWLYNRPEEVAVFLNETSVHNHNLPPLTDAVVTLTMDNETKSDTIENINAAAMFVNIPHRAIGKEAGISFTCEGWIPVDTTVILTPETQINIARDPHKYGDLTFRLFSDATEQGVGGVPLSIAGQETVSAPDGRVSLSVPLEYQNVQYRVECNCILECSILTMPTNSSTAIIVLRNP